MRKCFFLRREPRGKVYRALVDRALEVCDRAVLVDKHKNSKLSPDFRELLMALGPHMLDAVDQHHWPGNACFGWKATVYTFRLVPESAAILKTAVEQLYAWIVPQRLEDLSLVRPDGTPWLVTIAHEQFAYFIVDDREKKAIIEGVPGLQLSPLLCPPGVVAGIGAVGKTIYEVGREPKGPLYRLILDEAVTACDQGIVVDAGHLNSRGRAVLGALKSHVFAVREKGEWPGVRLLDGLKALVHSFSLQQDTCEILKRSVDGLYAWKSPNRPEYLCLMRSDGAPWLVSDPWRAATYFVVDEGEKDKLLTRVGSLRLLEVPG